MTPHTRNATAGVTARAAPWLGALCVRAGLLTGLLSGLLTACGGGGTDDPGPPVGPATQSGQVAAGSYIGNAVVFLDLNDNNILDSNERRTATDAQGRYALTGLYAADLAKHSIVARVFPNSINADSGKPVGLDCTLKAPVGMGAFVSPYSTLVSSLMQNSPALTPTAAAAQVATRLKVSTLPLTAPAQMDLSRDYVQDSQAGTPTASDSRNLRFVATSVAAVLSRTTAGLNQRQTLFDANSSVSFNALVTLTEAQLTQVANSTHQFDQLTAAQQADFIANPGSHSNFFINGNDLIAGLIAAIDLSSLSATIKDWVFNSDAFKQFVASVFVDITSTLAELLFEVLF